MSFWFSCFVVVRYICTWLPLNFAFSLSVALFCSLLRPPPASLFPRFGGSVRVICSFMLPGATSSFSDDRLVLLDRLCLFLFLASTLHTLMDTGQTPSPLQDGFWEVSSPSEDAFLTPCNRSGSYNLALFRSVPRPIPIRDLNEPDSLLSSFATVQNNDAADIDDRFIHVPGVTPTARISRHVMLKEIASSLGLTIHSVHTTNESINDIRGCIEMDMLPRSGQIYAEKQIFFGEAAKSTYYAIESVAETVILHLIKEKQLRVDDANYNQVEVLQRRLKAAKSFEDIYTEKQQKKLMDADSAQKCNQALIREIQQLCHDHGDILPLKVSKCNESNGILNLTGSTYGYDKG